MKKKILFSLIAVIMCCTLVGCGKEEEKQIDVLNDIIDSFTNTESDNNDSENDENDKTNADTVDIKLYSDNTKMVFNFYNQYNIVYYYSGDSITGLELYYDYKTEDMATLSKNALEQSQDPEVKSIVQKGQYVIITYNEEAYKDMTVEEVKQTYSYLEQVYEE